VAVGGEARGEAAKAVGEAVRVVEEEDLRHTSSVSLVGRKREASGASGRRFCLGHKRATRTRPRGVMALRASLGRYCTTLTRG
jgi:hypothetical protein